MCKQTRTSQHTNWWSMVVQRWEGVGIREGGTEQERLSGLQK